MIKKNNKKKGTGKITMMQVEFLVNECWSTKEGLYALREKKVSVNNGFERDIATLTYPTIQFIYEAWLKSGDEPCCVDEDDEFNGEILFSIYVVLKGNTPNDRKFLADDETGLMWESHDFVNEIPIPNIDFSNDDWKTNLEVEMKKLANEYVKKVGFTLDKPNF